MIDLAAALPVALPGAIAWAEATAATGLAQGEPLTPARLADARAVGVAHPERIRIVMIHAFPQPDDPLLRKLGHDTGLLGPDAVGLALGHAIFIREGHVSRRLLTHEFRHVHQYEAAGSIAIFLLRYLREIATVGYAASSFERDARRYEMD